MKNQIKTCYLISESLNKMANEIGCVVFYDKNYYLVGDGVILCESKESKSISQIINNIKSNVYLAKKEWKKMQKMA